MPGRRIFVFGPQPLGFDSTALGKLSSLLRHPDNGWILDVLGSLPDSWRQVAAKIQSLHEVQGEVLIIQLCDALRTGEIPPTLFPLPHTLLSPILVASQLAQYSTYSRSISPRPSQAGELHGDAGGETEVLGLCTGALGAFAVGCSSSLAQLKEYGEVAIRLAMAIGAIVDAEVKQPDSSGPSGSLSVSWTEGLRSVPVDDVLKDFPDVSLTEKLR